ncbi:glycosyltransferase family 4 protein [Methanosarcina sp. T3]|uniref:glycosyltransferase family 4 protein n=1 Tax=Methanosarcina sp. T3 TaxID=3439062 RepID=UPI003F832E1D
MKIGIVVPYFTPYINGNEYGLAKSLSSLGHKVTVITSTAKAPREKKIVDPNNSNANSDLSFSVNYLPTLVDFGDNPIVTGGVRSVKDYDVLMLQEDYPYICHKVYRAAKKHGIPMVLSSERTYYPENPVKLYALKTLDITVNKLLRNGVEVLTAHCTAAKNFMSAELGVKREIRVVNVGVDSEVFKPLLSANRYLKTGDLKILTVARLHEYKGLEYLIEAMQKVAHQIPEAHLYILGKGSEEQNLKKLKETLELERNVTFISESIPNYKMPELYSECDIYVQPSIIEPYGIAVLEAMACGKPVVGTKVGGMLDTIKDGECGFLVDSRSPDQLADKILLLGDGALCEEFGKAARTRVQDRFDWIKIAYEYQRILDGLV